MVNQGIVLGHINPTRELRLTKRKLSSFPNSPLPTNVKTMRQFLRHVGFCRRFIKNFSKFAKPIYKLLEKDAKFSWDDECQRIFEELKAYLTAVPIVRAP